MHQGTFFGHLGRNAEVRSTPNGTTVCNFPLGVNVGYGQNQHTLWIDCAMFGKRAEGNLPQYLGKGVGVVISGDIDLRMFQRQDQSTGAAITCNVRDLAFTGSGNAPAGGQNPAAAQNQGGQQRPPQNQPPQNQPAYGGPQQGHTVNQPDPVDDFDDDIPF